MSIPSVPSASYLDAGFGNGPANKARPWVRAKEPLPRVGAPCGKAGGTRGNPGVNETDETRGSGVVIKPVLILALRVNSIGLMLRGRDAGTVTDPGGEVRRALCGRTVIELGRIGVWKPPDGIVADNMSGAGTLGVHGSETDATPLGTLEDRMPEGLLRSLACSRTGAIGVEHTEEVANRSSFVACCCGGGFTKHLVVVVVVVYPNCGAEAIRATNSLLSLGGLDDVARSTPGAMGVENPGMAGTTVTELPR